MCPNAQSFTSQHFRYNSSTDQNRNKASLCKSLLATGNLLCCVFISIFNTQVMSHCIILFCLWLTSFGANSRHKTWPHGSWTAKHALQIPEAYNLTTLKLRLYIYSDTQIWSFCRLTITPKWQSTEKFEAEDPRDWCFYAIQNQNKPKECQKRTHEIGRRKTKQWLRKSRCLQEVTFSSMWPTLDWESPTFWRGFPGIIHNHACQPFMEGLNGATGRRFQCDKSSEVQWDRVVQLAIKVRDLAQQQQSPRRGY